jgi:alpha-N-arabinofuranosidase
MTTHIRLFEHSPASGTGRATIWIDGSVRSTHKVSPRLFGKFCEHLGSNIYNGMEAQILLNPIFGRWSFTASGDPISRPDGGVVSESDSARIEQQARRTGERMGLHDAALLLRDLADGCAFGWVRLGGVEDVRTSPDCGPRGDRAQRVEILGDASRPLGIAQRTYLPLHRTWGYEFRLVARAFEATTVTLSLAPVESSGQIGSALASAEIELGTSWGTAHGTLYVPVGPAVDPEGIFELSLTAASGANVVIDRLLLYPDDHVGHADPDVIRMLRESGLPLLRWPGGNFVSGYHWRDGVGVVDARPTLPNPAWPGLEPNLFGTDEFVAFCRQVGCEPMICVNAGSGSPEEAAAWVEYCNGTPDTPMGRLRADQGNPEPYGVRIWEIGNEVHGDWQVGWTTAGGYVDRYRRFASAMRAVDPAIEILACGEQLLGLESEWNRCLIDEGGETLQTITDHLLTGGSVGRDTSPVELYHAFMGYAGTLGDLYRPMVERMEARGIEDPHIAVTELQLFAHFSGQPRPRKPLRPERLPTPATISEALYVLTMINAFIRTDGTIELLTHSATVNHGGGLRKTRERVWANPVHYAHQLAVAMAGGTPVQAKVACDTYATTRSFGHIPAHSGVPVLDAVAVISADGSQLIVMLMNRAATGGAIDLAIVPGHLAVGPQVDVVLLGGDTMYDQNTLAEPERIAPRASTVSMQEGQVRLPIRPFSLVRLTFDLQPAVPGTSEGM